MNKLAFAANDGIEPASYLPWLANPLACSSHRCVSHELSSERIDRNEFVNDFKGLSSASQMQDSWCSVG